MFFLNKVNVRVLFVSFFIAMLFFLFSYNFLKYAHFHEDAYILFIYVENFINGYGITYYPGGPNIEGATDFLWMIFLSVLGFVGFDIGTASVVLNSVGVFIVSYILFFEIKSVNRELYLLRIFLFSFSLLWIGQTFIIAAVGGFSVFLYISIVALCYYCLYKRIFLLYIPFLSLVLGLLRPDGVVLGFGFVLVGAVILFRKDNINKYFLNLFVVIVFGLVYF